MKYSEQVIVKRWVPILEEYEKTKARVTPRQFKFVKHLCAAHHISRKELTRYYRKWLLAASEPRRCCRRSVVHGLDRDARPKRLSVTS